MAFDGLIITFLLNSRFGNVALRIYNSKSQMMIKTRLLIFVFVRSACARSANTSAFQVSNILNLTLKWHYWQWLDDFLSSSAGENKIQSQPISQSSIKNQSKVLKCQCHSLRKVSENWKVRVTKSSEQKTWHQTISSVQFGYWLLGLYCLVIMAERTLFQFQNMNIHQIPGCVIISSGR